MCLLKPSGMEIRIAEKRDLPQIIDLCKEHAEYEQVDYERNDKSEMLSKFLFWTKSEFKLFGRRARKFDCRLCDLYETIFNLGHRFLYLSRLSFFERKH